MKKKKTFPSRTINYWVMILPALIWMLAVNIVPMFGVVMAFQDFNPGKGIFGSEFVGLENFRYMFQMKDVSQIFFNTVVIAVCKLFLNVIVPVIFALLLNEIKNVAFKRSVQTIVYLPHFISWVVLSGILINLLSTSNGAVNEVIKFFGGEPIQFLQSEKFFRSVIVISDIWKEAGWGAIVYIAAISGIDREMFEAARVDGVKMMQKIWYITLPSIAPTITVLFILRLGSILKNGFEQIFMLYSPVVYDVADVFETYTYRIGMQEGKYGFASAVGLFQSVVGLILVLVTNKISRKVGDGGLW